MSKIDLWAQYKNWREECKWVDLSRPVSPETPHWSGYGPLEVKSLFNYENSIFKADIYSLVGQYGTHLDAPIHFAKGGRTVDQMTIDEFILPLCVIDKSAEVAKNDDYKITIEDVTEWEKIHGRVPAGTFVAFRSDWSKRPDDKLNNADAADVKHYPGWDLSTLKFLVEERNVAAFGHETFDTDSGMDVAANGYQCETYVLEQDRFQIEVMVNLDQCPPTGAIIFSIVPNIKGGSGFTARCFALCPK